LSWDTEVKQDIDIEEKQFIYLGTMCEYVAGESKPGQGIEKLEWIPIEQLEVYDIVPPAKKLFIKLGYLSS
jgi:8-oxo-dGTP pyrophosphatase MutT (NUDIX family)